MTRTRIAQVGGRGFGQTHLDRIDAMVAAGRAELVGIADPAGALPDRDEPWFASLADLVASVEVDVVSIATPIGTHMELATQALDVGADVMLEKPPVASYGDFVELQRRVADSGRAVQIGFQSLGSAGISRMQELAADLGEIRSVQVWGMWLRPIAYYQRAAWAGRRVLNGARVADGVITNPLSHGSATAFAIVGLTDVADIDSVVTEMYHAHAIEADDTSWVRVHRSAGVPVDMSLTLCGPRQEPPTVSLVGERGSVTFGYTQDLIDASVSGRVWQEHTTRTDLLENLLDHRDHGVPLLVPLASTVGFMALLEATQSAPPPVAIAEQFIDWSGEGDWMHPVISDIEQWQRRCLDAGMGYLDAGAPWADPAAISRWTPPGR